LLTTWADAAPRAQCIISNRRDMLCAWILAGALLASERLKRRVRDQRAHRSRGQRALRSSYAKLLAPKNDFLCVKRTFLRKMAIALTRL
jgi:hypothetical protein